MKTHVLQLDAHDDVTSVCDKMAWAKTERILLVFPRRFGILRRTLDLRLLQRHAAALGAQLAIVARSEDLKAVATSLGIPTFTTSTAAQRETWETGETVQIPQHSSRPDLRKMRAEAFPSEAKWRGNAFLRFTVFFFAVLAILAVLALFFPSASIELSPSTQLQSLTLPIRASEDFVSINLTGELPARSTFAVIERSKTVAVTGAQLVMDKPATGVVRFRNLTTELITIPPGTVVSTNSGSLVRFATTSEGIIAAGLDKTVDVPVQALIPGPSSNLPADTLVAIEGDLGPSLSVSNPAPTTGGTDTPAPIQTAEDRQNLRADLLAELLDECMTLLPLTLTPGDTFFPDSQSLAQVLSETYLPEASQTGETLSLTMTIQCQAQYAAVMDVNTLAGMVLDANLPAGYVPISDGLSVLNASAPATDPDGVTRWEIQIQRLLRAEINTVTAAQLSTSRKPADAAHLLGENLPLVDKPIIAINPDWWPWMPVIPFRISVTIQY